MDKYSVSPEGAAKPHKRLQFEDALVITGFGKFNYYIIFLSGMILVSVLLETLGMSFVIPVAQCDIDLTTQQKGILSAAGFAGIISSSHLWGFLADTRGRRRMMLPTLIIAFGFTVASSFVKSVWIFTLFRFINGFFISGPSATIYAYLGEFHNPRQRARAIMGASIIFGTFCVALPTMAWLVLQHNWSWDVPLIDLTYKPWRLFVVVCGLPALVCAIGLSWLPESPKFLLSQGKNEETFDVLAWVYSINTGKPKNTFPVASILDEYHASDRPAIRTGKWNILQSMWDQTSPLFRHPHLRVTVIGCVLQFGIFATSSGMCMWFPDIVNRIAHFQTKYPNNSSTICNIVKNSYVLQIDEVSNDTVIPCNVELETVAFTNSMILESGYAVGFLFIGLIINAVGKLPIIVFVLFGCGTCGIVCVFLEATYVAQYVYLVLLMCGLAVNVVNTAVVDLFPTHLRAMAVCICLMMGRLGGVAGASIVGLLLDYNCSLTFEISGSLLIACGFIAFFIPNVTSRKIDRRTSIASLGQ